jgi:hypothetical protein
MTYLNKNDCDHYDHVVLANDSVLITRSLKDFRSLLDPATEMVALTDSNQTRFHYPDFLRAYNQQGLKKIKHFYTIKRPFISNFQSVVQVYELESSTIFHSVRVLFKSPDEPVNIHFDNALLANYLYFKNYPLVKIKKINNNEYPDNHVPLDFKVSEYKKINVDLSELTDEQARLHFINCGMKEGRYYKTNQPQNKLELLENYLRLVGF